MNLIDLINYFKDGGSYEVFCSEKDLNLHSEVVEVFSDPHTDLPMLDVVFFEIEKTKGALEFEFEGKSYKNLCDFYYFLDFVEDIRNLGISSEKAAEKLVHYLEFDA